MLFQALVYSLQISRNFRCRLAYRGRRVPELRAVCHFLHRRNQVEYSHFHALLNCEAIRHDASALTISIGCGAVIRNSRVMYSCAPLNLNFGPFDVVSRQGVCFRMRRRIAATLSMSRFWPLALITSFFKSPPDAK